MKTTVVVLALLSITLASVARASSGGPEVVEALGWDPLQRTAYFSIAGLNESGQPARIVSFAPGGSPRGTALSGTAGLDSLRKRLRPMPEGAWPTIPTLRTVLRVDALEAPGGRWTRFHVRARGSRLFNGVLEVTTIGDPDVRVVRRYDLPDLRIGIVSFRGLPWEDGYEVQIPVILPGDRDTLRIVRDELR